MLIIDVFFQIHDNQLERIDEAIGELHLLQTFNLRYLRYNFFLFRSGYLISMFFIKYN